MVYKIDIVIIIISLTVVIIIGYIKIKKIIEDKILNDTNNILDMKMKQLELQIKNNNTNGINNKSHIDDSVGDKVDNKVDDIVDDIVDDKVDNKVDNIVDDKDNEQVEKFIVSDAQNINNYIDIKNKTLKEDPNQNKIDNPPTGTTVDYDKPKIDDDFYIGVIHGEPRQLTEKLNKNKYLTSADFGWDAPFPTVSCANSSINDRFKTGPKQLLPSQISCGYPNKLTAENYYKTHYRAQVIPLEDYLVRGANYEEYSDSVHPTKTNVRILSLNTKGLPPDQTKYKNIPIGTNFAFHNTPAMRMP